MKNVRRHVRVARNAVSRGVKGVASGGCGGVGWGEGGNFPWIGEGQGVNEGVRSSQEGPRATGIRSSVGTGSPATTRCPFRRARTGAVERVLGKALPFAVGPAKSPEPVNRDGIVA